MTGHEGPPVLHANDAEALAELGKTVRNLIVDDPAVEMGPEPPPRGPRTDRKPKKEHLAIAEPFEAPGLLKPPEEPLEVRTPRSDARMWSYSSVTTYTDCGEKYRLMRVEKVDSEPQGTWMAGLAVHDTIEKAETEGLVRTFVDGGAFDESNIPALLIGHFEERLYQRVEEAGGPDAVRWGGRKSKANPDGENYIWWLRFGGPTQVRRFLHTRLLDDEQGIRIVPDAVEAMISAVLPSGNIIRGRVDAVLLADKDGQASIRDYKSGVWKQGPMQLTTYAYLIEQALGIKVERGEYCYLRTNDPIARLVKFNLARFLPVVEEQFGRAEKGMEAEIYMLNPSSFCASCSVRHHCAYGRLLAEEKEQEND